jgi:hypothetical protein
MRLSLGRKILTAIALVVIIAQSFSPYAANFLQKTYAQEDSQATVSPTSDQKTSPAPIDTISPTPTVTPTPTDAPTPTISPSPTVAPSVTPIPTDNLSPPINNSPTATPIPTISPAPTDATVSATPTPTNITTGNEQLSMTILKDVSAPSINLDAIASQGSASLITDKPDYAPTDTALITGSNLLPNTTYILTVSSTDNPSTSKDASVMSDDNGVFAYAYQLDGNYRPNYKAELKDETGTVVATTTFTDTPITPSTNDINRTNGWAHVDQLSQGVGTTDLQFISTRVFWSCFEYRTDGDISKVINENGGANYNSNIRDGLYPYFCEKNSSDTKTIHAIQYVEVRMVFGAETDERFDWTRFDVATAPSDTTPPPVPTLVSPANGAYVKPTGLVLDWSDVSDLVSNPVTYYYQSALSPSVGAHNSLTSPIYGPVSQGTNSQIDASGTADGTYYWQVKACDALNNCSDWSGPWKITVDNITPTTPTINGFLNPNLPCGAITNIKNVTVDWSDSSDANGIAGYNYEINYPLSPGPGQGTWDTFFTTSQYIGSLNEGTHYIKVQAKDLAGNVSNWSNVCSITYDSIAPVAQVTSPADGALLSYVNNGTFDVRGTVTDSNPDHYYLHISGPGGYSVGPGTVYDKSSFTDKSLFNWNLSGLASGSYTIDLEARDAAGNKDAGSVDVHTVTVDNTAPLAPTITSPSNGQYFTVIPIIANWTAVTDSSGISKYQVGYVYDDHHTFADSTCSDLSHGGCRDVAGNVTSRGHVPGLNEQGGVTIYVRAVDGGGNVGAWSKPIHYVYDATAPTTPVATPSAGDYDVTSMLVTLTSTESGSGLAGIYYTTDGTTTPDKNSTPYSGPITVDQDMTIKAIAYDNAGNESSVLSAAYGVVPIISNEHITGTGDNSLVITWTTNFPTTSRVIYDTTSHPTPGSGPNYGYAYSIGPQDTSPKVKDHSVTITGVNVNQTYYYRVISGGSPEAVGKENPFTTRYTFGLPGDGLSDGASTGTGGNAPSANTAVLGATSLAFAGTGEEVLGTNTQQGEVLGVATNSATPTPSVSSDEPKQTLISSSVNWVLNPITITIVTLVLLAIIAYFVYRKRRNSL